MSDNKKRADVYRLARDLIRERFADDPIADACDDRIKQLDPKPQYEDGQWAWLNVEDTKFVIGQWSVADNTWWLGGDPYSQYERAEVTNVQLLQLADDQHVIVPVVTTAINTIRIVAHNCSPGDPVQAVLNAYAEAVEARS